jgi:hypothetical protein
VDVLVLGLVAFWRCVLPRLNITELDEVDLDGLELRGKSKAWQTLA